LVLLLEQGDQPTEERMKERFHIALREASEEAQDGIIAWETLEASSACRAESKRNQSQ